MSNTQYTSLDIHIHWLFYKFTKIVVHDFVILYFIFKQSIGFLSYTTINHFSGHCILWIFMKENLCPINHKWVFVILINTGGPCTDFCVRFDAVAKVCVWTSCSQGEYIIVGDVEENIFKDRMNSPHIQTRQKPGKLLQLLWVCIPVASMIQQGIPRTGL